MQKVRWLLSLIPKPFPNTDALGFSAQVGAQPTVSAVDDLATRLNDQLTLSRKLHFVDWLYQVLCQSLL